jgi:hypothetical protein
LDYLCKLQLVLSDISCELMLQCNIIVTGEKGLDKVIWDMTKLEAGLLDYDLKEGFKTDAIKFECGEGWVNPERDSQGSSVTFAQAFPWGS